MTPDAKNSTSGPSQDAAGDPGRMRRAAKRAGELAGLVAMQQVFGNKALERADDRLRAVAAAKSEEAAVAPSAPDFLKAGPARLLLKPYLVTRLAASYFIVDDALSMASMLAFTLVLALFPFLIFITAFAAIWGGAELAGIISEGLFATFPEDVAGALQPEVENVLALPHGGGGLLTFGLAVMLFSLTGAVEAVRTGLNRAYALVENRSILRTRFESLLFVLGGSLILVLVALLAVVAPLAWRFATPYAPQIWDYKPLFNLVRLVVLTAVLALLVLCLHRWLPAKRLPVRALWVGVVATLGNWWALGVGFSFYLSYFGGYTSTYAGLAGIVATLMFFYLASAVLLFGGEVNRALYDLRRADWPGSV